MVAKKNDPQRYVRAIKSSGLSVYDPIEIGDPVLWIPTPELETLLNKALRGISLAGLPLRTRSKVVKTHVCHALGYPVPVSFRRTQPRFPGQFFDTYVQKANNLQVWNQELAPTRRYVLIRVSAKDVVTRVKVVTGDTLASLDTTGTLTQKYQARCVLGGQRTELIAVEDTTRLRRSISGRVNLKSAATPVDHPREGQLLPITILFKRLSRLVGTSFRDTGHDQERNRGAALHRLVCKALGYGSYQDDGRFPDVRHQLLEVKLQTSPTIDLGLVRPDSVESLDVPKIGRQPIRHCDVRYAVFCGRIDGNRVVLTHFFLTTGEAFFSRFPQFRGKVLNKKLQIPLPADFFDR
ncbi:MAG: restriction endonuclease [Gammaproteobacteria bacterium]|nr:MAG: restriction endonuclease [Gammaproteobacteria bacterium]